MRFVWLTLKLTLLSNLKNCYWPFVRIMNNDKLTDDIIPLIGVSNSFRNLYTEHITVYKQQPGLNSNAQVNGLERTTSATQVRCG